MNLTGGAVRFLAGGKKGRLLMVSQAERLDNKGGGGGLAQRSLF